MQAPPHGTPKGDVTLNDGQPGYLCVRCDVFWPRHYFTTDDLSTDKNRRVCANHRAKLTLVEHGLYSEAGLGITVGCFEPFCAKCASK